MKTEILPIDHPGSLAHALAVLDQGGVIAFPTDTVYGLGARVNLPEAIARLYTAKARPPEKAIPVLIGSPDDLPKVSVNIPPTAHQLARHFWPGPLTLVIPRHPELPAILGPLPTVGVRQPDHIPTLGLLQASGPLAVTSANRSGGTNARTAEEVLAQLGGHIPLILDGGTTPGGSPSTVVDCTGQELRVLRPGPITPEELWSALHLDIH